MALSAGTRIGPYEIISPIGAGGMGEVYRARDTRLDRTVAIKVLPEHLSSNQQLRDRFEREAKAISSLSHPHICSLYDIGHQDGVDFLVMEYLEGETLAHRLKNAHRVRCFKSLQSTLRYAEVNVEALLLSAETRYGAAGWQIIAFGAVEQGSVGKNTSK